MALVKAEQPSLPTIIERSPTSGLEADCSAPPANERSLPLKEFGPVGNAIMPQEDNRCESENDWRKDHI
jgi:hypothetical protein